MEQGGILTDISFPEKMLRLNVTLSDIDRKKRGKRWGFLSLISGASSRDVSLTVGAICDKFRWRIILLFGDRAAAGAAETGQIYSERREIYSRQKGKEQKKWEN